MADARSALFPFRNSIVTGPSLIRGQPVPKLRPSIAGYENPTATQRDETLPGRAGNWTDDPDAALAFLDEVPAHDYSIYRRTPEAKVVMRNETKPVENGRTVEANGAGGETHFYSQSLMIARENTTQSVKAPRTKVRRTRLTTVPLMAHQMAETVGEARAQPVRVQTRRHSPKPETSGLLTLVKAKVNVGFGNILFIRGQGKGLSWEKGLPLECIDGTTWVWSSRNEEGKVVFKLVLNDQVWAKGDDIVVEAGTSIEVNPAF